MHFVVGRADAILALLLILMALESLAVTSGERKTRRHHRSRGYCANPTSKGGYCRNRPGPAGGRCGANHPAALQIPRFRVGTVTVLVAVAAGCVVWQPLARYLVPLLPPEMR